MKQYFLALGTNGGTTLNATDGTGPGGTKNIFKLDDSLPGTVGENSAGSQVPTVFTGNAFAFGSKLFFTEDNSNGYAAYATDGNTVYNLDPAVPGPVTDTSSKGTFSSITPFIGQAFLLPNGTPDVAFLANRGSGENSSANQIALSDGTGAGTKLITSVTTLTNFSLDNLVQSGNLLYFRTVTPNSVAINKQDISTIFATDGTTTSAIDTAPGANAAPAVLDNLTPFINTAGKAALAFLGYTFDQQGNFALVQTATTGQTGPGTQALTLTTVTSDGGLPNYYEFVASGTNLFTTLDYYATPKSGSEERLISSDGVTQALVQPGTGSDDFRYALGLTPFTNAAGQAEIAFAAADQTLGSYQIYVTTGSQGRTATEVSLGLAPQGFKLPVTGSGLPANAPLATSPVVSGNTIYYPGRLASGGNQVFATNGGPAVRLDPNAGSATPTISDAGPVTAYVNAAGLPSVAFFANTSTTGSIQYQLLTSNGQAGGTKIATGFSFASLPAAPVISAGRLFFTGQDNSGNLQAYSSNGSTVSQLSPAGAGTMLDAGNLTAYTTSAGANGVAFTANAGTLAAPNYQVFVSDGTTTKSVTAGKFSFGQSPNNLVANGGTLYWSAVNASGHQGVYSTDGVTAVVDDPATDGSDSFSKAVAINLTSGGISARNAVQPDAKSGVTGYTFNVERSGDTTKAATFNYAVNGSGSNPAGAGLFTTPLTGTVSFAQGQSLSILTVGVNGQTLSSDAGFTVTVAGTDGTVSSQSPSIEPRIPVYVLASASGTIQQNVTPQPTATPSPTPTPTPVPTPSSNPAVAAFVTANLPAGGYNVTGIALASAGLGALAGQAGTVNGVSSTNGSFGAAQAGVTNVGIATAPASGSKLALPAGYAGLVAQGGNAVTLSDNGAAGAVLVGNGAGDTFNSSGTGVSLVGGGGGNTFNLSGSGTVSTGDGASTVNLTGQAAANVFTGTGGSTVVLAGGSSTVQGNGQDTVFGGAGASTVTAAKGLVAVGGAGLMTFLGGSATSVVFGGKGGLNFTGGSAFDIAVGLGGPLQAKAGSAGGEFFGNTGSDVLQAGTGQTIMVLNSGGRAVSTGSAGNFLVAGAGKATLDGSAASGTDVFFGGTGQDDFLLGSGSDLVGTGSGTSTVQWGTGNSTVFAFGSSTISAGSSSGGGNVVMGGTVQLNIAAGNARSFALFNFVPGTDHIGLQGYDAGTVGNALANQVNGSGQTVLTLGDQTVIQLIGVSKADSSFFS